MHSNLIASAAGTCTVLDRWGPGDRHICYLPLAHIYERINLVGWQGQLASTDLYQHFL
jgi:long-chain acyl-CoA synthetase